MLTSAETLNVSAGIFAVSGACRKCFPASWTRGSGGSRRNRSCLDALAQALEGHIEHRDHEDADRARGDHAGEDGGSDAAPAELRCAMCDHQRSSPRMKATDVIITARKRICAPRMAASVISCPASR